jgi:DNA modification methylase
MKHRIIQGDCVAGLRTLPDASVHCCVTSPPYWGLRSYLPDGHDDKHLERGLEQTPEEYVARMVEVFREVRRVLREDGTCWVNLGDSYAGSWGNQGRKETRGTQRQINGPMMQRLKAQPVHDIECCLDEDCTCPAGDENGGIYPDKKTRTGSWVNDHPTLKAKDLVGIPWRVAFALQADGWWLRQDIIWHKPNPMPESVRDRCTKAHEYVFLLTKSERYFYDAEAVSEASIGTSARPRFGGSKYGDSSDPKHSTKSGNEYQDSGSRNRRSVWTITTRPYKGAHFAVMPADLVEPCILAGTSEEGCCPYCGAPWARLVEKRREPTRPGNNSKVYIEPPVADGSPLRSHAGDVCGNRDPQRHCTVTSTAGWQATCDCPEHRPERCIVLDPFAGSGTTLAVAARLGRNGIGCELNPEYIALAEKRIAEATEKEGLFA